MFASIVLQIILPAAVLLYFYIKRKYSYWSSRGIAGPKPSIFTLGNAAQIASKSPLQINLELFRQFGKVYGNYNTLQPVLTISDAELIKQVLIKDFASFVNRRQVATYHWAMNNGLLFAESDTWKRLRSIASPNFTTSKLRKITPVINSLLDKLENYFETALSEKNGHIADTFDPFMSFAIETIATTTFATEVDSADRTNPFVVYGLQMSEVSPLRSISYFTLPGWFNRLAGIEHPFNAPAIDYYMKAIMEIVKQSRAKRFKQQNLVQLLIDSSADAETVNSDSFDSLTASMEKEFNETKPTDRKKTLTLSDEEIVGVSLNIFAAGFHTIAVSISGALFELAQHPHYQERLYAELTDALDGLDDNSEQFYAKLMNGLPYLDAVIKETNRKYPALARMERRLVEDKYKLGKVDLVKDQLVEISTFAVHYNPEYYPQPEVFDPERFMPENKHRLVPYSYLAFGEGPRNCIGMRYAYQEMKFLYARLLRKYRFETTPETPKELTILPFKFATTFATFPLKVTRRN